MGNWNLKFIYIHSQYLAQRCAKKKKSPFVGVFWNKIKMLSFRIFFTCGFTRKYQNTQTFVVSLY